MVITFAHNSRYSAQAMAEQDSSIELNRGNEGDINWGRASANTSLNPDISNSTNKRIMRELFKVHEVPMPRLLSIDDVLREIACGKAVVGRPDRHMKGFGFWYITDRESLNKALRGTRRKRAATHFMEYVYAEREYRVHIFKGRSIRISQKSEIGNGFTTLKPQHNVDHVRAAAKKAVEAVGLDFGAVDVLADDENCWVTEVNSAPGLGGSMPRVYVRAFKKHLKGDW